MSLATLTAARIESLPAVASPDWCDLAAAPLSRLPGVLGVTVVLARAASAVQPLDLDAVGLSVSIIGAGQPTFSESQQFSVRSRLESLASTDQLSLAAPMLGAPDLWGALPDQFQIQAWSRIADSKRVLVVQVVASGSAQGADPGLSATLDALTPLLARRASIALGDGDGPPTWLTRREQVVLEHLILGESVREIAELINRSPHTIHDHVKNLHRKLSASSRGALIARALGHGVSTDPASPTTGSTTSPALLAVERSTDRQVEPKPGSGRVLSDPR